MLSRLKLKRFRLAIDDFGTGYASLAQLRDLPFDELKIDRGFVHGSSTTGKLQTICAASIRMAHELRMSVVAEGIETDAEWKLMRQLVSRRARVMPSRGPGLELITSCSSFMPLPARAGF